MALDFVVIGAQRAGTTWMFSRLSMHPDTYFPLGKEVNFWNQLPEYRKNNPAMIKYYRARFSSGAIDLGERLRRGDISPYYATMPSECILQLYKNYPKVRTILVVRNPILRAFSARRFSVTRGKKPAEFLETKQLQKLFRPSASPDHSDYVSIINCWRKTAASRGASPLEVIFYDDILLNPVNVLKELSRMIDIDPGFYDLLPARVIGEGMNQSLNHHFPAELYPLALDYYRPVIVGLQAITGRDLSGWLRPDLLSEYSSVSSS